MERERLAQWGAPEAPVFQFPIMGRPKRRPSVPTSRQAPRSAAGMIGWERYAKPADLERRLRPLMGQRPGDVQRFAASQRMEVSALIQNVVYASAPAPSRHPLIQAKWLVEFRFNDNRLAAIHVERGLIGP